MFVESDTSNKSMSNVIVLSFYFIIFCVCVCSIFIDMR